jgi:hypothetical protein
MLPASSGFGVPDADPDSQLISLGYGKYVRSDDVVAIDRIEEGRGPGRRTHVWVRGVADPLVASRSDGALADDLVTPAEEAARMRELRRMLSRAADALDGISPGLRRVLREESGIEVDALVEEARRVLG